MLLSCPVSPKRKLSDAMQETLLAMLILASCVQDQGDEEHPVELPTIKRVTTVRVNFDGGPVEVKIELPVQPDIKVIGAKTAVLGAGEFRPLGIRRHGSRQGTLDPFGQTFIREDK